MKRDLISVVIPVYNVENYLQKCIDSVCNQTYRDLQVILVDDGSTDNCGKLCDEAQKKDGRITVIHKKNGGLSDARNHGIEVATGKYITFIDSDDYISEDCIEYLYNLIIRNNAQVSAGGLIKTSNNDDTTRIEQATEECMSKEQAIGEMLYARKFSTSACAKLYLTELFSGIRFPYGKFSEDMYTTYKLLNKASKVVYGNQICYYYVRRCGSIIVSPFSEKHMDVIEALDLLKHDIPIEQYGIVKAYSSQIIECIAAMLERKPSADIIYRLGLWDRYKENRANVLSDSNASKRVKGYALISYLGLPLTIWIINTYYGLKWKNK